MTIAPSGTIYGITNGGGQDNLGTEYSVQASANATSPTWSETVLHSFTEEDGDGYSPTTGGVLLSQSGSLYGVTQSGGEHSCGIVYELTPLGNTWSESILYSFEGDREGDGCQPYAGLVADATGNLYGTTTIGGELNFGTVYKLSQSGAGWAQQVLYSFQGGTDGGFPLGTPAFDQLGNLTARQPSMVRVGAERPLS